MLCFITMNELFCRQLIVNLVSSLINSTSTDSEEMSEDSESNSDEEIFVNTPNKKKSRVNIKKTNCSMSSLNAWYQVKLYFYLRQAALGLPLTVVVIVEDHDDVSLPLILNCYNLVSFHQNLMKLVLN